MAVIVVKGLIKQKEQFVNRLIYKVMSWFVKICDVVHSQGATSL